MINIYKIFNTINDKIYIGQTINTINNRFKQHCQKLNKCWKIMDIPTCIKCIQNNY